MRNGKDKNSCLFGEELVSYIYGELPTAKHNAFESHLLNCSACTAEFADMSMSRLGVFEWHRDEFLPLATPHFVIPYEKTAVAEPEYSWVDALRGLFSPARFAMAGGAFAVLAVAFTAIYVATSSTGSNVAVGVTESVTPVAVPDQREVAASKDFVKIDEENAADTTTVSNDQPQRVNKTPDPKDTKVIQVKSVKKPVNRITQSQSAQKAPVTNNAPRLGTYVETEDTSLRLADLVADIDTKDK